MLGKNIDLGGGGSGAGNFLPATSGTDIQTQLDGKAVYNYGANTFSGTGDIYAGSFYGDGSDLSNVGVAAANVLTIMAKVNEVGGITKGYAVYVSGATGQFPQVSLADNTDPDKSHAIGVAAETKSNSQNILIRVSGELDTLNTNSWENGDALYVDSDGSLTTIRPISGQIVHIGHVTYKHVNQGKIVLVSEPTDYLAMPAGLDLDLRMGDAAGANRILFEDYNDVPVGWVDSNGNAQFLGDVTASGSVLAMENVSIGGNLTVTGSLTSIGTSYLNGIVTSGTMEYFANTITGTGTIYAEEFISISPNPGELRANNDSLETYPGRLALQTASGNDIFVKPTEQVSATYWLPDAPDGSSFATNQRETKTISAGASVSLSSSFFGRTYVAECSSGTNTIMFLPTNVTGTDIGGFYTFVRLGIGTLTISGGPSYFISNSSAGGTVYQNNPTDIYSTITLQLAQANRWVITGWYGFGWDFT